VTVFSLGQRLFSSERGRLFFFFSFREASSKIFRADAFASTAAALRSKREKRGDDAPFVGDLFAASAPSGARASPEAS